MDPFRTLTQALQIPSTESTPSVQPPAERDEEESERPASSSSAAPPVRNAPLVIVSERGRHSDESRRIVRAQAARASAAASRVTRARNREEREGIAREVPQSPQITNQPTITEPVVNEVPAASHGDLFQQPLVAWLSNMMDISPQGLLTSAQTLSSTTIGGVTTTVSGVTSLVSATGGGIAGAFGSATGLGLGTGLGQPAPEPNRPQLPLTAPRGFRTLQQRVQVSDNLMSLVSRASCFDFGSAGVEERLRQLLFDMILGYVGSALSILPIPGHPVQGHLRIACTCVTIFQGQRADGAVFAYDSKYQKGLEAAWSEAMLLDQTALKDLNAAEASLWAVFVISVTTGSTAEFFRQLLDSLFQDLRITYWSQVRDVLRDFIYPVSFLDEPCKMFYDSLQAPQIGMT